MNQEVYYNIYMPGILQQKREELAGKFILTEIERQYVSIEDNIDIGFLPEVPDINLQVLVFDDGPRRCREALGDEDGFIQEVIQHRDFLRPYFADKGHCQFLRVKLVKIAIFDKFGYVWCLSGGFNPGVDIEKEAERLNVRKNAAIINKNCKEFVMTQGGKTDITYISGEKANKLFDEVGLNYEYQEVGEGHTWYTWKLNLYDEAQRLFKKK